MSNWSIFGIGPVEAIFIIIMMLIILGPKDMVNTGRRLGQALRRIRNSPTWKMISTTSQAIRNLPDTLASETGMEELQRDLLKGTESLKEVGNDINKIGGSIDPRSAPESLDQDAPEEGQEQLADAEADTTETGPSQPASQEPAAEPQQPFSAWTTPTTNSEPEPAKSEQTNGTPAPESPPSEQPE